MGDAHLPRKPVAFLGSQPSPQCLHFVFHLKLAQPFVPEFHMASNSRDRGVSAQVFPTAALGQCPPFLACFPTVPEGLRWNHIAHPAWGQCGLPAGLEGSRRQGVGTPEAGVGTLGQDWGPPTRAGEEKHAWGRGREARAQVAGLCPHLAESWDPAGRARTPPRRLRPSLSRMAHVRGGVGRVPSAAVGPRRAHWVCATCCRATRARAQFAALARGSAGAQSPLRTFRCWGRSGCPSTAQLPQGTGDPLPVPGPLSCTVLVCV